MKSVAGCFAGEYIVHRVETENIRSMALALSNCTNTLWKESIFASSANHRSIEWTYQSSHSAWSGCIALSSLLQNPQIRLRELHLGNNNIDDACVTILADASGEGSWINITTAGLRVFSSYLSRAGLCRAGVCMVAFLAAQLWVKTTMRNCTCSISVETVRRIAIAATCLRIECPEYTHLKSVANANRYTQKLEKKW